MEGNPERINGRTQAMAKSLFVIQLPVHLCDIVYFDNTVLVRRMELEMCILF